MQIQWTKTSEREKIDAASHRIIPRSRNGFDPRTAYAKPGIRHNILHPATYFTKTGRVSTLKASRAEEMGKIGDLREKM